MAKLSAEALFRVLALRRWRRPVFAGAAVLFIAAAVLLPSLKRDTTITSFLPADNPAILHAQEVSRVFGLHSPLAVAILASEGQDIFEPGTLQDVVWLTEAIKKVPNVDPESVRSLATASSIGASGDDLKIEPLITDAPKSNEDAAEIGLRARSVAAYSGLLFAKDGSAALITASMIDQQRAGETYKAVEALTHGAPVSRQMHVAGIGAVSGFLSEYLRSDSKRMGPLSVVATLVVVFLAFRTGVGLFLPFLVVVPSVVGAIALMAALDIPYFVITSALPPILVAMAVTDALHIMSFYYREMEAAPQRTRGRNAASAIVQVWRPITLTELTTVIGFFGAAVSSSSPPMFWFSIFGMVGVTLSYFVSLALMPGALAVFARRRSPAFSGSAAAVEKDLIVRMVAFLSGTACRHPGLTVLIALAVGAAGAVGITRIDVDSNLMDQFPQTAPIAVADRVMNERFAGTNTLDIIVSAPEAEGMLEPARLAKVDAMQAHLRKLPHTGAVTSIVDYLKQVNQALNGNDPNAFALPQTSDAVAQELLLLTSGTRPGEWSDRIDQSQSRILVRVYVNSGHYKDGRAIVEAAERYIQQNFADGELRVDLAGSLNIAHNWLKSLAHEHVMSAVISLVLVFLVDALLFRSATLGFLSLTPVIAAIMLIYSTMGFLGVPLDAATSMFAAISIGLGVDFAVHTVNWITRYMETDGCSVDEAVRRMSPASGRAQFYNFAIFFAAFGIIGFSELPTMQRFGGLVALAIFASFLSAITLIPAIMKLLNWSPRPAAEVGGALAPSSLQRS